MKVHILNLQDEFIEIPENFFWNGTDWDSYDKWTELHFEHGWRDVNVEPCDLLTQKYLPNELTNNEVWKRVVDLTEEEMKPIVPERISKLNLKIQLLLRGITREHILLTIDSIPESMFAKLDKDIAVLKFDDSVYLERYNADLNLIATLEGLSQDDVDEIFINGNL
jgi:hypothetical protein